MRISLLLLFFVSVLAAQEAQPRYDRLRVYTEGDIRRVAALGLECDHGHHRLGAYFESDFSEYERQLLDSAGIRYELLIEDVSRFYVQRNKEGKSAAALGPFDNECGPPILNYPDPQDFQLGSMGGFLTYSELFVQLDSMRAKYPHLISPAYVIDSANMTHEGRFIHWLRISDNPEIDENEPEILYTALHHSREPLSAMQMVYYMWYLLENYDNSPEIRYLLDNAALYFVPCVNPDGYVYIEQIAPSGGGMWRKNRRNNGGGTFGVDLNRNYGFAFAHDNAGSSGNPASDTYRGPVAFSEPETRNIRSLCNSRRFELALNYHSFGNMLIYPWAYNSTQTADSLAYRELSVFLTRENRFITGTNEETVGYSTNGDADDWFYGEQNTKGKILSMTPEAGYQNDGFWPAQNDISRLCRLNLWQNLRYAQVLLHFGELQDRSTPFVQGSVHALRYELKRYGYGNGAFEVRAQPLSPFIQAVGAPKVHSGLNQFDALIDSIEVLVNPNTPAGTVINLLLELDNGSSVQRDTVFWIFGEYQSPLFDSANTMNNWVNLGTGSNWGLASQYYYSAPTSIGDSPNGRYANNRLAELLLMPSIDLSEAAEAHLQFWARWDIEKGYDYAQIMASADGQNFEPLCGQYTVLGTNNQDFNKPLYDGTQNQWLRERISLNDYLGEQSLSLKWRLQSDALIRGEGMYFDDFSVRVLQRDTAALSNLVYERSFDYMLGQSRPNPARTQVFIPLQLEAGEGLRLQVYNALGQEVYSRALSAAEQVGISIDISHWAEGIYYYQLRSASYSSPVRKMQVSP